MYKILEAKELTTNIYLMVVEAPRVAKNCQPGQFVIVRMDEDGERIPLTVCDYDREMGTITIVFQTVGAETTRMAALKAGILFMILSVRWDAHLKWFMKIERRLPEKGSYLWQVVLARLLFTHR